jgi:ribosomal protein S18 acetylase RimI-like enzyme
MKTPAFIQVKTAHGEHFRQMILLAREIFELTFAHTVPPAQMRTYLDTTLSEEVLAKEVENPNSCFFLVQVDETPIGYIKLNSGSAQTESRPDTDMEIQRFYLHPRYHGTGMADLMMNTCENFSLLQGKTTLWLGVAEDNLPAVKFYIKQGFIPNGRHAFDFAGDIQWDILVEKKISR